MSRAAVIGAGTMGNGIAHVLAQHGWDVALIDSAPAALEKATATIRSNLDRQVKKGALPAEAPAGILGRIRTGTGLEGAKEANLVVEAASENPAVKFSLFEQLDRLAPAEAILPVPGALTFDHVVALEQRMRLRRRLELRTGRDLPVLQVAPQRDHQPPGQRHDAHASHALARGREPPLVPVAHLAVGLVPQPAPGQLHQQ